MRPGARRRGGVTHVLLAADAIPAIGVDGRLFPVGKLQAHRSGQLHLAVSVFVFSGDDMLIQRRAGGKYHCGGLWANSCCTHPNWDESLERAAARRTFEELGVHLALASAGRLTYRAAVTQGLIEHEQVQVFHAEADKTKLRLAPDPAEVMDTRWASRAALQRRMQTAPRDFAPWFRIYLRRWSELGLDRLAPQDSKSH